MLDHICHRAPGKNLHFEPNADILRSVPTPIGSGRSCRFSLGSGRVCQQSQWHRPFRRSGGICPLVHLGVPPSGLACPISSDRRVRPPLGIGVVSVPQAWALLVRHQISRKSDGLTPRRRLTVNHLGVIVGETIARERAEQLIPLITKNPYKSTNLCWITNRQQASRARVSVRGRG